MPTVAVFGASRKANEKPTIIKEFHGPKAEANAGLMVRLLLRRQSRQRDTDLWGRAYNGRRWCEDVTRIGMAYFEGPDVGGRGYFGNERFHGYYVNEFCDETTHGVVLKLPSKDGEFRFMVGYSDPWDEGAANFKNECWSIRDDGDFDDCLREAMRVADGLAETMAEEQREYEQAYSAGAEARQVKDECDSIAADLRSLLSERRYMDPRQRDLFREQMPSTYSMVCARIRTLYDNLHELRRKRDKLVDEAPTFDKNLHQAWEEGFNSA